MKKIIILLLFPFYTLGFITANAQSRYCKSYEDYLDGRWESLDTVYYKSHSKKRQVWLGGNDYTIHTGDKAMDKVIKKEAFAIMKDDTLFVNCRNLRFEKTRFGNGYTIATPMHDGGLLFVNRKIGREAQKEAAVSGFFVGAIGGAIGGAMVAANLVKQQYCYIVSNGANAKGRIAIRLIDDKVMHEIVKDNEELHFEYWSEKSESKRLLASHILPILEKAGLISPKQ